MKTRCGWATNDHLYIAYHDQEWGVPQYDDRKLFEFLILEGAQAGLSWITILRKRENYQNAFDYFDAEKIAAYDSTKIEELITNPGIIRNKLKIIATVENAKAFLRIQKEYGSFRSYIWQFVNHQPLINHWQTLADVPTQTEQSNAMSKDLKKRGFKFVGSTICYAYMQATGMVLDHTADCFRHRELSEIQ